MTRIEYYEDEHHNKFLVISYNNRVDYCKVTSDGSQMEPMIRTTRTDFQIFSANQNWIELSNAQKQVLMKGLIKLYKVKGQTYRICAISSGDDLQWAIMIEDIPRDWSKTSKQSFEDQWGDKLEDDNNTAFTMFGGMIQ